MNPIIEKIEAAIKAAPICLAEVSEDNPNVWLELGYALALERPVVILCDRSRRSGLPFDVQHRPVIFYRTDSRSGFEELEVNIIKWVKNELGSARKVARAPTLKPESAGIVDLEDFEVAMLTTAFSFWPTPAGGVSYWDLETKLESIGFAKIAVALGIAKLIERGYFKEKLVTESDQWGNEDEYKQYAVTPAGIQWIQQNQDALEIRNVEDKATKLEPAPEPEDDDIPF